ncbi:zinc-dependent metalloprotease [Chitinophaga sedimenti]|uniref:zinc-dependent metalloprotease n=1 Tax=Chitinophaga sedimenti TaxID=2033606 RepID=UPI0020052370|nr:zinc-dependent metalloprotease [Chitinophaga sedimenti]MCK7557608.1 zinc-dependent metalloprotease [Chitinophaga sedimenti]
MKAVTGVLCATCIFTVNAEAQRKKKQEEKPSAPAQTAPRRDSTVRPMMGPGNAGAPPKAAPKKFGEFITAKAVADSGLFNVYKQDDRFMFEIPDALLGRDILVVNRVTRAAADGRAGMSGYAGDQINENVIRFEKGPNNRIFLKNISFSERSKDSSMPMYTAVMNSNLQPIVASFDIKAFSKGNNGSIIDMTEYIAGDNDILFFDSRMKNSFRLGSVQQDKSYIVDVKSYPMNTEIRTVKTYGKSGGAAMPGMPPAGGGAATLELNSSIVLLPAKPMEPRYFDPRVGYFATGYTDFDADPQGVKRIAMITRWRLEPKDEDRAKWLKGELVEPKKPIIYYIDPATPKKWIPYLIAGVNDWQVAFEQAGFKNAIVAKLAPTKAEDSTWSLEDARYSAIVYKPSDVPNASGPHVHDPRSGEILETHINWYHNVMHLLRNWYMVQASPNDPRARSLQFSDELMGELIRFVSSHEVGHTLGLRHNFGSSSAFPVEKLRDKEWVKANGHAPSIMDYARFNYVAQPGDGIVGADLYPRINFYDKWAIEWGYKVVPGAKTAEEETPILNQWVINRLKDKKYWFGTESNPDDPRSQNEDLGDNAMKAGAYGIKNLQYIIPNLLTWTKAPNEGYADLNEVYNEVVGQFFRYMGHAAKNIAGVYETPKTSEQPGAVYEIVPKATQKEAVAFLQAQLFTTPKWLINTDILSRINGNAATIIGQRRELILNRLLSTTTLNKLVNAQTNYGAKAYPIDEYLNDLKRGIFKEVAAGQKIDVYRRNLQKMYVTYAINVIKPPVSTASAGQMMMGGPAPINPEKSDISSVGRAHLIALRSELRAGAGNGDAMSRYHIQDLIERINVALDPKS